jgi:hypothetical protein
MFVYFGEYVFFSKSSHGMEGDEKARFPQGREKLNGILFVSSP